MVGNGEAAGDLPIWEMCCRQGVVGREGVHTPEQTLQRGLAFGASGVPVCRTGGRGGRLSLQAVGVELVVIDRGGRAAGGTSELRQSGTAAATSKSRASPAASIHVQL